MQNLNHVTIILIMVKRKIQGFVHQLSDMGNGDMDFVLSGSGYVSRWTAGLPSIGWIIKYTEDRFYRSGCKDFIFFSFFFFLLCIFRRRPYINKYWKITERENIVIIVPKFLNMVINCIHVFKLYINHWQVTNRLLIEGYLQVN